MFQVQDALPSAVERARAAGLTQQQLDAIAVRSGARNAGELTRLASGAHSAAREWRRRYGPEALRLLAEQEAQLDGLATVIVVPVQASPPPPVAKDANAPRPHAPIAFTRFASRDGVLTKRFERGADGSLTSTSPLLAIRDFSVRTIERFSELASEIGALKPTDVLAWGVPIDGQRAGEVTTKSRVGGARAGTIARSRDYVHFADAPAIWMLDVDLADVPDRLRPDSLEEVRTRLISAAPALAHAPMLALPSAGAMIFDAASGKQLRGLTGVRAYLPVACGAEIPELGRRLRDRLVLGGHGFPFASKAGTIQVRTVIDATVWQPERLDFIGGAVCGTGLVQRRGDPMLWNADAALVQLEHVAPLSDAEFEQLAQTEAQIKRSALPMAIERRDAFVEAQRARGRTVSATWSPDGEVQWLEGDHTIELSNGSLVTVDEILAEPDRYHGQTCADPMEPDYRGDPRLAQIYTMGQEHFPVIHSYAHGGVRYALRPSAQAEFVPSEAAVASQQEARDLSGRASAASPAAGTAGDDHAIAAVGPTLLPTEGERIAALHGTAERAMLLEADVIPDGELAERWRALQTAVTQQDPLRARFRAMLKTAQAYRGYATDQQAFDTHLRLALPGAHDSEDARLLRTAVWALVAPQSVFAGRLATSPGQLARPRSIERDWVVEGLAARGWLGALIGPSSGGKTFAAVHLAASIGGAGPEAVRFAGNSVQRGTVLYCPSEDVDGVRERLQRCGPTPHVHVAERVLPLTAFSDALTYVQAALDQIPDLEEHPLRLIVIDTLRGALGGLNENDAGDMAGALHVAKLIARMTGAVVLLLHHTGHENQERGRGSSAFNAELDFGLVVKKDDDNLTLTVSRLKTGPAGEKLRFHLEGGTLHDGWAAGPTDNVGAAVARAVARAVHAIADGEAPCSRRELKAYLADECPQWFGEQVNADTASSRLTRGIRAAKDEQWIRVRRKQLYPAAEPPNEMSLPPAPLPT